MAEKKRYAIGQEVTIDAGWERARFISGRTVPAEWLTSWRNILSLVHAMLREQGAPLSPDARAVLLRSLVAMDAELKQAGGGY